MGLVLLITVGAILGWLASILLQIDVPQEIMVNVGAGIGGALISALFVENGSLLTGISASAFLIGVAGSILILVLVNVIRQNAIR